MLFIKYSGDRMNNVRRWCKAGLSVVSFAIGILHCPNLYSFDFNRVDISIMDFFKSLSFNYKGFDIKVNGITISETFDDNVTFDNDKNKMQDFITDVGGGVSIKYEGKAKTLELAGNVNSQTFAENNSFNNITQNVTLQFKNEFSEYDRMSLKNVFTHTDAPLFYRDDFFDEQFERTGGRFDSFKNRFTVNYSRDMTRHITLIARYANDMDMFSGIDIPDSFLNKAGAEANYLLSSSTVFFFSYDVAHRQFINGKDALINTITPGIRQYFTKKIYFDGKTGLDLIDSFDGENLIKPNIQSSLTYEIDENTRAKLLFIKRYETNSYTEDLFNQWRASLLFSRQLLERLGCSLSLFYGDGEFISSDFSRKLMGASPVFTYDINKNLKGNLTYTYSQLDSDIKTSEYTKNTVFLGFVAEF